MLVYKRPDYICIIRILYPFYLGFFLFILRGDLLSSLSYSIGFSLPIIIYNYIIKNLKF